MEIAWRTHGDRVPPPPLTRPGVYHGFVRLPVRDVVACKWPTVAYLLRPEPPACPDGCVRPRGHAGEHSFGELSFITDTTSLNSVVTNVGEGNRPPRYTMASLVRINCRW